MIKQYKGIDYLTNQTKPILNWCGYVRIPDKHPWLEYVRKIKTWSFMGKTYKNHDYDKVPVKVHGGLTFADYFPKKKGIFSKGWWIGWDYAHAGLGDFIPGMIKNVGKKHWTEEEVEAECQSVIKQMLSILN